VSSNLIVSLDLALLRLGDRIMRRLFAENTRCLASLYASETYAMADESGARRARYWIPAEAEMRGIKDLLSYLWFMVWAVTLGGGSAILTITPTAAEAYLRVVLTACPWPSPCPRYTVQLTGCHIGGSTMRCSLHTP
jgi:hypothetical protein